MQASQQRSSVSQEQLDRSAAIIGKMARRKRRAKTGEKLDAIQRYAFVPVDGRLFAIKAKLGSKIGIVTGGIGYPVRVPKTTEEMLAVLHLERVLLDKSPAKPPSVVELMAQRIIAAAGRGVERRDFHQAGIADVDIDPNFAAAMKLARKREPRLDQMVAA